MARGWAGRVEPGVGREVRCPGRFEQSAGSRSRADSNLDSANEPALTAAAECSPMRDLQYHSPSQRCPLVVAVFSALPASPLPSQRPADLLLTAAVVIAPVN